MATIERRQRGGRRSPVRWWVRWRDPDGRQRSKTFEREEEARRFRARLDGDLAAGTWVDPTRARVTMVEWTRQWRESILDLRPSILARLDATVRIHVLPEWGGVALSGVVNADVRAWAARLHAEGLSASSVRKAVFALRRILAAGGRRPPAVPQPADDVPLPTDEAGEQRYLTAEEVAALADVIAPRFRALVLVAAYGGLRFGELAALRRDQVDALRGRVAVVETLVDIHGQLTFGPTKTRMGPPDRAGAAQHSREVAMHLERFTAPAADALLFTGQFDQPLRRAGFRRNWWPASRARSRARRAARPRPQAHLRLAARAPAPTSRKSPRGPATPQSRSPSTVTATSTTTPTTRCPTDTTPSCRPACRPTTRQSSRYPPVRRPPDEHTNQAPKGMHRLAPRCGVLTDVSVG